MCKEYFTGTMKHNLLYVDKFKTKHGGVITPEGKLPREIIRYDWRNPFQDEDGNRTKDEAIPEDFARFYIDITPSKVTALLVSNIIKEFLERNGFVFIDTCYFINTKGNLVFSEITPDGMRVRQIGTNESQDKDMWRAGKSEEVIKKVWGEFLQKLISERMEF